ncbi:MAG: hypothetical protein K9W43_06715 [Candidatus Thorarchaeota archaeon]|nr:hypothetical protein [Candidatus Thorarchaeota archaeon]
MATFSSEPEGFDIPGMKAERPFNPMSTYIYIAIAMIISYAIFYMFGYEMLIIVMLFFTIDALRMAHFILAHSTRSLARKASYYNVVLAIGAFILLAINGISFVHIGSYLILPSIEKLTLACPLLILTADFGLLNVRGMFMNEPEKKEKTGPP